MDEGRLQKSLDTPKYTREYYKLNRSTKLDYEIMRLNVYSLKRLEIVPEFSGIF